MSNHDVAFIELTVPSISFRLSFLPYQYKTIYPSLFKLKKSFNKEQFSNLRPNK